MSISLVFVITLGILSLAYGIVLGGFMLGIRALRKNRTRNSEEPWPSVSVILPARDEADVIEGTLESLLQQDYPGEWELVVVDDRSTDETPQILKSFVDQDSRVRFLRVTQPNPPSPKKNALALGIRNSTGEIIVTTDADCLYDRGWLRGLISHMMPDVGVVAGLTVFDLPVEHVPAWQKIQWLDFVSQQFLAAGAVGAGYPSSCNGSNLAYRRRVYDEIAGFGVGATQVSGDDVLFAQRVVKLTSWQVRYATEPATVVSSLPVLTVREMFHQRIRWASKGLAYRRIMLTFLFGMYVFYGLWLAAPIAMIFAPWTIPLIAGIAVWKFSWDFSAAYLGCRTFKVRGLLPYFVPFVILHTALSPVFGVAGLFTPYRWKGEWYRSTRLPRRVKRGLVRVRRLVRSRPSVRTAA